MAWSLQHLCHIILAAYKEILTVSWKTVVNGCWAQRSDKHAYNQHFLLVVFMLLVLIWCQRTLLEVGVQNKQRENPGCEGP